MIEIKPDKSKRKLFFIVGVLLLIPGIFFFPLSILEGYFVIMNLIISLCFSAFGLFSMYISLFYKILFDNGKLTTGDAVFNTLIQAKEVEGYFLTYEEPKKETEILIIKLKDGRQKSFDSETLGANLEVLKTAIKKHFKRLPNSEKIAYHNKRKVKGYNGGIIMWAMVCLFGCYLLLHSNFNFISVEESLEEPLVELKGIVDHVDFKVDRFQRFSRINVTLEAYPEITFSQVKNVSKFKKWLSEVDYGEEVIIAIAEDAYESKILKIKPKPTIIVNYDSETIEIKRLRNSNGVIRYKENQLEDVGISLFIIFFSLGGLLYCQKKKTGYNIS